MFKLQIKKDGQIIKSVPLDKAPTKEVIVHALNYDPNEKIQEAVTNLNKKNITDALGYEPPTANKVNESISSLVNSAPEALDTLGELSTALGNDPNFSTTITNMIANKLNKTDTAKNSEKVNNLTIETAVPANAKFTDTTYSTATELEAGLTKLYTKTGNNADGTITQEILTNLFNGKANTSHGNHVPVTETANNARFLRNDNTWQTITPGNIGAAATSHTHSYLPLSGGSLTGTMKWSSTSLPNKTSSSYAVVIDGFSDGGEMGWRTLGTAAFTNSTAYATASHTHNYLPLSGGKLTSAAKISRDPYGSSWQAGRDYAVLVLPTKSNSGYAPLTSIKTTNGSWEMGHYDNSSYYDKLLFTYIKDTTYTGTNQVDTQVTFGADGTVTATNFSGTINGYSVNKSVPSNALFTDTTYSVATASANGLMSAADKSKLNMIGNANYGITGSTTKIKIKINSTKSWMLNFTVILYNGYRATKVMISGYQYGNYHWHSPSAVILGDSAASSLNVYFGYDSVNNLWVGFDGGSYTGVAISDVCNGYTQIGDFSGLFTISNVSSLTTLQTTVTATHVKFSATPTSGQIVIADGTGGGIKTSGYTIATSVPSGAKFTDTLNTAGSTNTTSKLFLIGATSQAANPTTYSSSACYVTGGAFYSTTVSTGGNIVMGGTSGTSYLQLPSGIKLY